MTRDELLKIIVAFRWYGGDVNERKALSMQLHTEVELFFFLVFVFLRAKSDCDATGLSNVGHSDNT